MAVKLTYEKLKKIQNCIKIPKLRTVQDYTLDKQENNMNKAVKESILTVSERKV